MSRRILVTGGTGIVGRVVTPLLLAEGDELHLLVRGEVPPELAGKVRGYRGDVALPRLGLTDGEWCALGARITHVVHLAGEVRLNRTLEDARRTAVGSLEAIAALARMRPPGEVKLIVASTVGVAGRTTGRIPETRLPRPAFRNTYEQAKWEGEERLFRYIEEGMRATVLRPSMIVGDSRTGAAHRFQVFYHLCELFAGLRTGGIMPETGSLKLDLVPVDFVARAVLQSLDEDTDGRIFHLSSGDGAIPIAALGNRARTIFARHRDVPEPSRVSVAAFTARLPELARRHPTYAPFLAATPHLFAYLDDEQEFTNDETRAFLETRHVPLPAIETYLDNVLEYYTAKGMP